MASHNLPEVASGAVQGFPALVGAFQCRGVPSDKCLRRPEAAPWLAKDVVAVCCWGVGTAPVRDGSA
eukprot:4037512-Alexandrium_andersonii.AAC.1